MSLNLQVSTPADADAVLAEIARLENLEAAINAEHQQEATELANRTAAKKRLKVGRTWSTIGERLSVLYQSLYDWGVAGVKPHLPKEKKTLPLTHGTIQVKAGSASVGHVGTMDDDAVINNAIVSFGLKPHLDLIDKSTFGEVSCNQVLKLTFALNRAVLLPMLREAEPKKELRSLGLQLYTKPEQLDVKPKGR